MLTKPADHSQDWVAAGRALVQLLLELELAGGAASFLDQVVEDPASRTRLQDVLGSTAWPQLVLRVGIGGDVPPSARRCAHETVVQVG